MLATHNSFTYLPAKNPIVNLFSCLWRCQSLTLKSQYAFGVRYFDVRVAAEKTDNERIIFRLCHGRANLIMTFSSIPALDTYLRRRYPHAAYRLILERGNIDTTAGEVFLRQANTLIREAKQGKGIIDAVIIKHPWKVIFSRTDIPMSEYYCHPLNWNTDMPLSYNLRHLDLRQISIRRWARKHNPPITPEMIGSRKAIHMIDFFTGIKNSPTPSAKA